MDFFKPEQEERVVLLALLVQDWLDNPGGVSPKCRANVAGSTGNCFNNLSSQVDRQRAEVCRESQTDPAELNILQMRHTSQTMRVTTSMEPAFVGPMHNN